MSQATTSLRHRGEPLANPGHQLAVLTRDSAVPPFASALREAGTERLVAGTIEILQVNVGRLCNMACRHCHVDAGPDRSEIMTRTTIDSCLDVLRNHEQIQTLDVTGGAPEMNPHFRHLVREARGMGRHVIDRCNLTILLANGYQDLPDFLAAHHVEVVASLPCYLAENTDAQRGDGAFASSIEAIRRLNRLGYGRADSGLRLTLVYNPVGASLPADQSRLEADYRRELKARYELEFTRLFTITNMPISRYLEHLIASNQLVEYMQTLVDAFNPAAISRLMCRNTLSVGWDGRLFDCDFNQMLDLEVETSCPSHIDRFDYDQLAGREIAVGQHCFGCTAGAGSGCQGAITR